MQPRVLRLDDFGSWSPSLIYALAMRGEVIVSLPVATLRHTPRTRDDRRRMHGTDRR